jgi:formylglycine-generating enzyme required for sulfatase activity
LAVSLEQFSQLLSASGLISAEELSSLLDALPPDRKTDGEQLARELVRQKRLTAFQAQQIYQGKGKHLVLGNYVALDKLGQGGMGMVLKAEHKRMKRLVALKVLSPNVTKTPEALRRFQREVEAAAKLSHANIVTAFDADEAAGTHFLVMEYVEGTDLSGLVKKGGPLAIDKALNCVIQAARGLQFAHANGVVHRDIKPANLLLDRSGTIKILDMGLARLDSAGGQQDQLTGTGQIMGTVDYMAPEQAMDTKSADARADIYSLGVTLWNLLTGRALYDGETTVMKLMAHQNKPIPSLRTACSAASADLEAVFNRMVAKTPEARYQTMTDVIADLQRCQGGQAVAPSVNMGPGEDSRLNDFLRGMGQAGTGGATVGGVALQQAAAPLTAVEQQTVNLSNALVGTDPQTQRSLSPSVLGALTGRRPARNAWLDRLPVPPQYRLPVLIGGGLAAVLLAGILLFWQTEDGTTVRIEINDPKITVRLDGTGATLTHLDKGEIKLEPGQHGLRIKVGDVEFQTDKFVLADGDDIHLKIELLDGQVQVAQGDKSLGVRPMAADAGTATAGAVRVTPPATIDPDRAFATWAIANGVPIIIRVDGQPQAVDDKAPLPDKPFTVHSMTAQGRTRLTAEAWDEGLRLVKALPAFEGGYFPHFDADRWAAALVDVPSVLELNAYGSDLTDDGLASLAKFASLKYLNLDGCANVTAAGLLKLAGSASLEVLELGGASIDAGEYPLVDLQRLQDALPKCRIQRAGGGKPIEGLLPAGTAIAQPSVWPYDPPDGRPYAWGQPEHLGPGVNSPADEMLWGISDDERTIYFIRAGDGLYASHRESADVPFPSPMPRLLAGNRFKGSVTSDGLVSSFSTPAEKRQESVRMATRAAVDQPFGEPALLDPPVNNGDHAAHPMLSADGLTLLITSTRPGSQSADVWVFTRDARDRPFDNELRLPEPINTPDWDMPAYISNDRTMLIASTQQRSHRTFRYFTRADANVPFGPAQPLDLPLGSAAGVGTNGGYRLSGDGRAIYFHTGKLPGTLGRMDIYVCRRVPADAAGAASPARAAAQPLPVDWPADAPPPAIAPFDAAAAKQHQQTWADYLGVPVEYTNSIGMKFALIPPGEFLMGSTSEEIEAAILEADGDEYRKLCIRSEAPQHRVILTRPFYLGVHEVTQTQYEQVLGLNPSRFAASGEGKAAVVGVDTANHPVEQVNWIDAAAFCSKLSANERLSPVYSISADIVTNLEGIGYRLPTEAQWEFACRGGTTTRFWTGDQDDSLLPAGWHKANSGGRTRAVGQVKPNPFGLFDMHGNVFEWVQDRRAPDYYAQFQEAPAVDPSGPPTSAAPQRVTRGGSLWQHAAFSRSSHREWPLQMSKAAATGFRVALPVDAVKAAIEAGTKQTTSTTSAWHDWRPRSAFHRRDGTRCRGNAANKFAG